MKTPSLKNLIPKLSFLPSLFLFLLTGTPPLTALVEQEIDPKSTPEITLSTTATNRFMVENRAVADVIYDEDAFTSLLHTKTGQAFLTPIEEIVDHPNTITIISDSGNSQTFQVFAKPGPGEIVILTEKPLTPSKDELLTTDYHSHTVSLLNKILKGKAPEGYGILPLEEERAFLLDPPLRGEKIQFFEGPFERILVVQIQNRSKRPVTLSPEEIKTPKAQWAFIANPTVLPGEKTLAILSIPKEY